MTQRGGSRAGAGRPAGAKSKRTAQREAAVQEAAQKISEIMPGAFEGDAHAFLMAVYKDPKQEPKLRVSAAVAAIRYEKPALASVEVSGDKENPLHSITRIETVVIDLGSSCPLRSRPDILERMVGVDRARAITSHLD
jgi:hypothetical protein